MSPFCKHQPELIKGVPFPLVENAGTQPAIRKRAGAGSVNLRTVTFETSQPSNALVQFKCMIFSRTLGHQNRLFLTFHLCRNESSCEKFLFFQNHTHFGVPMLIAVFVTEMVILHNSIYLSSLLFS